MVVFLMMFCVFPVFANTTTYKSKPNSNCVCINVWQPVCGKDGKTYSNSCVADCAKVEVVSKGACKKTK